MRREARITREARAAHRSMLAEHLVGCVWKTTLGVVSPMSQARTPPRFPVLTGQVSSLPSY